MGEKKDKWKGSTREVEGRWRGGGRESSDVRARHYPTPAKVHVPAVDLLFPEGNEEASQRRRQSRRQRNRQRTAPIKTVDLTYKK